MELVETNSFIFDPREILAVTTDLNTGTCSFIKKENSDTLYLDKKECQILFDQAVEGLNSYVKSDISCLEYPSGDDTIYRGRSCTVVSQTAVKKDVNFDLSGLTFLLSLGVY